MWFVARAVHQFIVGLMSDLFVEFDDAVDLSGRQWQSFQILGDQNAQIALIVQLVHEEFGESAKKLRP